MPDAPVGNVLARPSTLPATVSEWITALAASVATESGPPRKPGGKHTIPDDARLQFCLAGDGEGNLEITTTYVAPSEPLLSRHFDLSVLRNEVDYEVDARLTADERAWLVGLRGCASGEGRASRVIYATRHQELLLRLIDAGVAWTAVADGELRFERLPWPTTRKLEPRWVLGSSMAYRLDLGLTLKPEEVVTKTQSTWIYNTTQGTLQILSGLTRRQYNALAAAPDVFLAQAPEVMAAIAAARLPIPLPDLRDVRPPIRGTIAPKAIVILGSLGGSPTGRQTTPDALGRYGHAVAITATLMFRYGTGTVAATDTSSAMVIASTAEADVIYDRDFAAETALTNHLRAAGLDREGHGMVREGPWRRLVIPARLTEEVAGLIRKLRARGVVVELGPTLGVSMITSDGSSTYGAVEEDSAGRYVIDTGIVVDGERVSLASIAEAALTEMDGMVPGSVLPGDTGLVVTAPGGRLVEIPRHRVRELIGPFVEFFNAHSAVDFDARTGRKRIVISRAALVAEAFAHRGDGPSFLNWDGMAQIRTAVERLRDHGVDDVPETPRGFVGQLRDYQRAGVKWLNTLAELGVGGILADDMGLGKTVQLLVHIAMRRSKPDAGPVLVVAPAAVVGAWLEKQHFTPHLRMLALTGAGRDRHFGSLARADIVLTNYNTLRNDIGTLEQHRFSLLICDEAHWVKNSSSQTHAVVERLKADQVIMVTGSPVENNLGDLYSQTRIALPGLLGEKRDFQRHYRNPIENHGDAAAKEKLRRRIGPFMLRRTKDQVAASLPPKTVILRQVAMRQRQREVYEAVALRMNTKVWESVKQRGFEASQVVILDCIRHLQQACLHPQLLPPELSQGCIESAKSEQVIHQIDELVKEGRRILVFSQFVSYLEMIGSDLDGRSIPYMMFTGKTRDKDGTRAAFQAGKVPVLLVSLKAGGVGVDFTAADTVLLVSAWWNPQAEAQAVDRAHRIGQKRPVFVYQWIVENSIEAKILVLQQRKAALASAILDGDGRGSDAPSFGLEDIVSIFGERGVPASAVAPDSNEATEATEPADPVAAALTDTDLEAPVLDRASREALRTCVSQWVLEAARDAGSSIAALNRTLRLPTQYLNNRISGNVFMAPSVLLRAADALKVDVPRDILAKAIQAYGRPDADLDALLKRADKATP